MTKGRIHGKLKEDMKHVIELSEDIEQALEARASATGDEVVHLIEMAVASFVRGEVPRLVAKRRPDPPVESVESLPPCELPRHSPRPIAIEKRGKRRPDPIADPP